MKTIALAALAAFLLGAAMVEPKGWQADSVVAQIAAEEGLGL